MDKTVFEWDPKKDATNIKKHGVSFFEAQNAFVDPQRVIAKDIEHSKTEVGIIASGK